MTHITKYTLDQYNLAMQLKRQGLGSQRIANRLGLKRRGAVEDWINKGRKPYYFFEKRIKAANSIRNIERMRKMNRITQPKAVKVSAELRTKRLPKSAKKLSKELAYVLGVVYGDGHVSVKQGRVILGATDFDFVSNFKSTLGKWSGFKTRFFKRIQKPDRYIKNRKVQWVTYIDSIEASRFLDSFDLNLLLDAREEIKSAFLKGFFDSEGSVSKKSSVVVYNTDEKILKFVEKLLKSLDIYTDLHYKRVKSFDRKKDIDYFWLHINKDNRLNYYNKIGFSIQRKQDMLQNLVNHNLTSM